MSKQLFIAFVANELRKRQQRIHLKVFFDPLIIQWTSVNKPILGQLFFVLLSGCAYYPGEFYVVLCNKMYWEKLGLLSGWAYYPGGAY